MAYTYVFATGDGVTTVFPFSFVGQDKAYVAPSNIHVFVAGVETSAFSVPFNDPNKVHFTTPPPIGAEVLIRRIMPRNVPYIDLSRGNAFSQDNLNNTQLQQLYLLHEVYDGWLPEGFYWRTDIDMGGHRIINLADGVDPNDGVNRGQLDVALNKNVEQDGRLDSIEDAINLNNVVTFMAQTYTATGGETTIATTNGFYAGALYKNGLFQHKLDGAYTQTGGTVTLSTPLREGDKVYLILGVDQPVSTIDDILVRLASLEARVAALEA